MRIPVKQLRPFLAEKRIFLMGGAMSSVNDTAKSYRDDQMISIQPGIEIEPYSTYWAGSGRSLVSMGAFSYTHSFLPHSVKVGRYCSIALGLRIMGESHPTDWISSSPVFYNQRLMMQTFATDHGEELERHIFEQPDDNIIVGNDVWIGEHVTLARGITIGDGAIIATNATVTKDVPPYTVVGGVPAKVIRSRFHEKTIDDLNSIAWWRFSPVQFNGLDPKYPRDLAALLAERIGEGLEPFMPTPATYEDFRSFANTVS